MSSTLTHSGWASLYSTNSVELVSIVEAAMLTFGICSLGSPVISGGMNSAMRSPESLSLNSPLKKFPVLSPSLRTELDLLDSILRMVSLGVLPLSDGGSDVTRSPTRASAMNAKGLLTPSDPPMGMMSSPLNLKHSNWIPGVPLLGSPLATGMPYRSTLASSLWIHMSMLCVQLNCFPYLVFPAESRDCAVAGVYASL